jgi:hypothetical protein
MRVPTAWLLFGLSSLVVAQEAAKPEPAKQEAPKKILLHEDVQQLLSRETRDAAMTRILARGEHRGPGTYAEPTQKARVGHVVMCPQPSGPPIFAVFLLGSMHKRENVAGGHLITVAGDGAIVRCWCGNNSLEADAVFEDVNGDGVVDRIETMNCGVEGGGNVRVLFVLPITEAVMPTLRIAIEWREPSLAEWQTAWRVVRAGGGEPVRVQIGPRDPKTGEPSKVTAEWRWHAERKAWVGPGGGPGQSFVRMPPEGWPSLEEFAAGQRAKAEGR